MTMLFSKDALMQNLVLLCHWWST